MSSYFVYILRCEDGTFYTGITTDVKRRVEEHNSSSLGARYTRGRRPVVVVYSQLYKNRSEATREEARIKKLARSAKLLLVQ